MRKGTWSFALASLALGLSALTCFAVAAGEESAPIVRKIDVNGCVTLSPDAVKAMMGTREGRPYSKDLLDEDFKRIAKMDAVADVQFKREDVEDGVRILVLIREKDILRRIAYEGNKQVKNNKLRSLVKSEIGQRFDQGQVNRDRRAIEEWYQTEYYYFADVQSVSEPFEDGIKLVFKIDEGGRLYVQDIRFRGNKTFKKKELLKFMETRPGSFFTRGKYERKIFELDLARLRAYYKSKGFLDVQVIERPFEITTNTPKSKWQRRDAYLNIDIVEGDRYKVGNITFEGNKLVDADQLRAVLKTVPGEWFNEQQVQDDANKIRDIYGKYPTSRYFTKAYGKPVVTPDGAVMDLVFEIEESEPVVVERVDVVGLDKTQKRVVLRANKQLPGEQVDSEKVNDTLRNLRNTGYFKTVNVDIKEGSAPDRGVETIEVEETSTGKFQVGAGVSSSESFIGSFQLQQNNFCARDWPDSWKELFLGRAFVGGGQTFSTDISAGSKSRLYKVEWGEPYWFDKAISLNWSAYYKSWEWDNYDEDRLGTYIRVGKEVPWIKNLWASITYKPERVKLSNFDDDVSSEIREEEGSAFISRVVLGLNYSTLDNRFDPTRGVKWSATQEFAGSILGGDKDFWRSFLDGCIYHSFYKDKSDRPWVIALGGEIGMCESYGDSDRVPIYERMYAGGLGSIRGFEYNSVSPRDENGDTVGGEMRATASAELFFPIFDKVLRGSLFYDVGTVWANLDDQDDNGMRSSVGFGLHVKTPLGPMPIRLYFAHILDDVDDDDHETFQFTFGTNF